MSQQSLQQSPPAASDSSAADLNPDLAQLQDQAAQLDQAALGAGADSAASAPAPAPAPGPSNAQLIAMGVEMFRELVCLVLKVDSPKETLGPDVAQAIGNAWEPVCAKYGVDLSRLVGGYGPELAAVAVTAPLLFKAYRALDDEVTRKRQAEAATKLTKPAAPPPPSTLANVKASDFSADARKPWDPELAMRNAGTPQPAATG